MSDETKVEVITPEIVEEPAAVPQPPKRRRLRVKEEKFARAIVKHGEAKQALLDAGYKPTTVKSINAMPQQVLARPAVQARIDELLEKKYPDHEGDFANRLKEMLQLPLKAASDRSPEPGITVAEMVKLMELVSKMKGYNAPTKHASVKVTRKVTLPEE